MKKSTIIISFFNDFETLLPVLASLKKQYNDQFDVIIADDGSTDIVAKEIRSIISEYPFKLTHLWQEDYGFGKAKILNRAIVEAENEYLIFIDGDCIPQAGFVEDHLLHLEAGVCQAGRRVDIDHKYIAHMKKTSPEFYFKKHWFYFIMLSLRNKARNFEKGLRLKNYFHKFVKKKTCTLVGCNFSICRTDIININGLDERANVPWGAEDSDLDRRLRMYGVRIDALRYRASMIHFDRSYTKRKFNKLSEKTGIAIFNKAKHENKIWAECGIQKNI